ncbi:MAG: HAD family hydrolase [Bacteroidales bacterium]
MKPFLPSEIKNIIFDLGGVLLNINPLLSLLEFEKLSGIDKETLAQRLVEENVFAKFETGSLNPAQFRDELNRIMGTKLDDLAIDTAWNTLILDFPFERLQMLQQLRKNYTVYLLSNTNIVHFWHYTGEFFKKYNIRFEDLFDKLFVSYEIGLHKPDAAIYTYVLNDLGINPSETVFIDDSLPNIKAAAGLSINVIHITVEKDVTAYFESGELRRSE